MANKEYLTDLDAVDLTLGGVIALCYKNLAPAGSQAFKRFLKRKDEDKILKSKNDDIQTVLARIARQKMEPEHKALDLPLIIYYRDMGITGDDQSKTQIIEAKRYVRMVEEEENRMEVMRMTCMPVTLTYSILFLAWDRATLERLALAWWGYMAPRGRRHSRFHVRYLLDGEEVGVPCSITSPRETLTSNEVIEGVGRLWGSRTMCEINTQALYVAKEVMPASLTIVRTVDVLPWDGKSDVLY